MSTRQASADNPLIQSRADLIDVFARGETPDLGVIFTPPVLLPLLGLAALALLPVVIKAMRGKES